MGDDFINLHVHSSYSLGDSTIGIPKLIEVVKEYNQDSVALSDHGVVSGWFDFHLECEKNNIKPIYGCEFYTHEHFKTKSRERNHLIVLAKNNEGKKTIQKWNHEANKNFYHVPILPHDLIFEEKNNNVIVTSACALGAIPSLIATNQIDEATQMAERFNDNFEHFYLEIQMHDPIIFPEQMSINNILIEIGDLLDIPITISTDAHIPKMEDAETRSLIQAISWHKKHEDILKERPTLPSNAIGNEELIYHFADLTGFEDESIIKKAIGNTNKIANLCDVQWEDFKIHLPKFTKQDELRSMLKPEPRVVSLEDF